MGMPVFNGFLLFALTVFVCSHISTARYVSPPNVAAPRESRTMDNTSVSTPNNTVKANESDTNKTTDGGAYFPDINQAGLLGSKAIKGGLLSLNISKSNTDVDVKKPAGETASSAEKPPLHTEVKIEHNYFPNINYEVTTRNDTDPLSIVKEAPAVKECDDGKVLQNGICRPPSNIPD